MRHTCMLALHTRSALGMLKESFQQSKSSSRHAKVSKYTSILVVTEERLGPSAAEGMGLQIRRELGSWSMKLGSLEACRNTFVVCLWMEISGWG